MALSWVDNGYYTPDVWTYVNRNDAGGWNGSTNIWVRSSPSTSGGTIQRYSRGIGSRVNVYDYSGAGTTSNPTWIYYDYKNDGSSRGWSATWSSGFTYFELYSWGSWVDSGYWSGTAWAYYYYPSAGSTSYTRQASASRTSPSFTLRASPGSNTVDSGSSTITLTVVYNNGTSNATQNGTKFTRTVYSFSGWDEKTSASAPSSLTAGTSDYAAGRSMSDTRDLYYYADYTSSASTQYSNNTMSLGAPSKANTSTTYTITYAPNGGTVSPTSKTTSSTTTYRFSSWTGSTGVTINSSNVATFTQTGTATASYTSSTGAVAAVTLPTPTRSNYLFSGWLAPNGQTYAAGASYTPTSTTETLTAQWTLNQITLTLANSASWTGTYAPTGGGTLTPGASITLNQPMKTGWHFVSWTNASGTVLSYDANFPTTAPTTSTTYTANVARNTYKVRYDANGGTGTMAESNHTYGVASNLRTNTFTKNGATFVGWSKSSTATTADYTDGQSISTESSTNGGIVLLYAVWRAATNMFIYTNNQWTPALKYVYTSNAPAPTPVPEFSASWPANMNFSYSNGSWSPTSKAFSISNVGSASGVVHLYVLLDDDYSDGVNLTVKNSSGTVVAGNGDFIDITLAAGATNTYTVQITGTPEIEYSAEDIGILMFVDDNNYQDYMYITGSSDLPEPEIPDTPTYTNGYTVAAVSGSTYTFTDNGAGYYVSNNKGVDESYALARVTVTTDGTKNVIVEYQHDTEIYWDYGLISNIDTTFATSVTPDTNSMVTRPTRNDGLASAVKRINFGKLSAGTHTFDVKFIKDSSGARGTDSMKFKVSFVDTVPTVLSSTVEYLTVSGASYSWAGSYNWWYPKNRNIASSAALVKVKITANGTDRFYIDCQQSSQAANDFALISTDGQSLSTSNSIDTSNVLKSFQNATNDSLISVDLGVLSAGVHTYVIKYRKDGSLNYYDDCMQFRVRESTAYTISPSYKGQSVTVEPVSGSTYTFTLNGNDYYESNNKNVDSSYALAKVTVISNATKYIVVDCINYAEATYDYGILSTKNNTLTASTTPDTSNVLQSFASINQAGPYRVSYGELYGKMTFYVKYRKDGSQSTYNDSLQFKVNFLDSLPSVLNSSYTFTTSGTYGFIPHPFNYGSYNWYIPGNKGQDGTAALSKITITANGTDHVYLDYYQNSERNYDYGLVGYLDGSALASTNAVDSSVLQTLYGVSGYGTIDLGVLSEGTHTIYIKYRKDGDSYSGEDICAFHVRFNGSAITGWLSLSSYAYLGEPTVSGASYGFFENGDSVWQYQSRNTAVSNSAAVGRIYIRANGFDPVYVDAYSFGESTYDYCILGTMDGPALSTSNTSDSSNVALTTSGYQMQVRTYSCGVLSAGWHYIYIKYRKDGSVDSATGDVGYFNVRFTSTNPGGPAAG